MTQSLAFNTEYHCSIGVLEPVAPGLRRITANNPGPLTFRGTGTYVIGTGRVAVIDPGPHDAAHIDALLKQLNGEIISHIFVTHTHIDHSPGTALLQQFTQAKSYSLGSHTALQRQSDLPMELDAAGDTAFQPDEILQHEQVVSGENWSLQCLHTPGHASNHASFAETQHDRIFVGDLLMSWSTSVLLPPDGHLGDYFASMQQLLQRNEATYWPTHGAPINQARAWIEHMVQHRQQRVHSVLNAVNSGHNTLAGIVAQTYPGLNPALNEAALRSTLASVVWLIEKGKLRGELRQGLDIVLNVSVD